jgi:hypothetical protein
MSCRPVRAGTPQSGGAVRFAGGDELLPVGAEVDRIGERGSGRVLQAVREPAGDRVPDVGHSAAFRHRREDFSSAAVEPATVERGPGRVGEHLPGAHGLGIPDLGRSVIAGGDDLGPAWTERCG